MKYYRFEWRALRNSPSFVFRVWFTIYKDWRILKKDKQWSAVWIGCTGLGNTATDAWEKIDRLRCRMKTAVKTAEWCCPRWYNPTCEVGESSESSLGRRATFAYFSAISKREYAESTFSIYTSCRQELSDIPWLWSISMTRSSTKLHPCWMYSTFLWWRIHQHSIESVNCVFPEPGGPERIDNACFKNVSPRNRSILCVIIQQSPLHLISNGNQWMSQLVREKRRQRPRFWGEGTAYLTVESIHFLHPNQSAIVRS